MNKKGRMSRILPLIICLLLFLFALGVDLLTGEKPVNETDPNVTGNVIISEIMSDNRTYPDGFGKVAD